MSPSAQKNHDEVPSVADRLRAVAAVAATYAYFLVFAQFGFLQALTAVLGEGPAWLRPILTVMGAGGLAGSVGAAWLGRAGRSSVGMEVGFVMAGAAAGLTLVARGPALFLGAAALTGLGTGLITVGLAADLAPLTGGKQLGLVIGTGTGLAYALGNLPPVFAAAPATQAMLGMGAAAAGWWVVRGFRRESPAPLVAGPDYAPGGIALWIGVLLLLVWFDSAAFYLIQHTPVLKAAAWTGGAQLALNAGLHLGAALLAGWVLDRHQEIGCLLAATVLLLGGEAFIRAGTGTVGAGFYVAGVSLYSTVLVYYPARRGRAGLAALVYGVAGWGGSALGLGLVADRSALPAGMPVVTGLLVAGMLGAIAWRRRRPGCSKI